MIVKRFTGQSVEEALIRAKWELGDEAVLLSSGPAKDRWWKFWERGYQVLAATDYPLPSSAPVSERARESESSRPEIAVTSTSAERESRDERLEEMMSLLMQMDKKISQVSAPRKAKDSPILAHLLSLEVDEKWARELTGALPKGEKDTQLDMLQELLGERIVLSPPLSGDTPHVVVFIGPTGAGKTTTIAKLASKLGLEEGKRVLLITTDTFRVAASEQLQTFGSILDVPVVIAKRPQDVPKYIQDYPADVVLIDTPGHSISEPMGIRSGLSVVKHAKATDVLLCMPATYSRSLFVDTAKKLSQDIAVTLCLTKVDEALCPGPVLSALLELKNPVMYVTTGQQVPHDIESAREGHLLQWLVKGGAYHG
ncbi:flagellar biosynthesis protein FlhF [Sulfobacillus thermosulfidooxidans DSM 9293]|uniref:Flagellar biosynthesis protein FlhF n=1 Tax=Sulfobacillus thermosulfidooxidans (strain DSM 9293 / VKM B-1269 / AT-1) TaxID=929705 RepID=A0A1W1WEI4_SULTA|nr:flagellar biosynthesis protein FlhF [Sulfobacillus thermosulfidooxidans]SMC04612.1 flagellar biosynthesis protein FlhF [Sulfobacillus thermosulfidooxidans DSM 9293]